MQKNICMRLVLVGLVFGLMSCETENNDIPFENRLFEVCAIDRPSSGPNWNNADILSGSEIDDFLNGIIWSNPSDKTKTKNYFNNLKPNDGYYVYFDLDDFSATGRNVTIYAQRLK